MGNLNGLPDDPRLDVCSFISIGSHLMRLRLVSKKSCNWLEQVFLMKTKHVCISSPFINDRGLAYFGAILGSGGRLQSLTITTSAYNVTESGITKMIKLLAQPDYTDDDSDEDQPAAEQTGGITPQEDTIPKEAMGEEPQRVGGCRLLTCLRCFVPVSKTFTRWVGEHFGAQLETFEAPYCTGSLRTYIKQAAALRKEKRGTPGYCEIFLREIILPQLSPVNGTETANLMEDNKELRVFDCKIRDAYICLPVLLDNSADSLITLRLHGELVYGKKSCISHEIVAEICSRCKRLTELSFNANFQVNSEEHIQWPYPLGFADTLTQLHCLCEVGKGFINHVIYNCTQLKEVSITGDNDTKEYLQIAGCVGSNSLHRIAVQCADVGLFHQLVPNWTDMPAIKFQLELNHLDTAETLRVNMEAISTLAQNVRANLVSLETPDAVVSPFLLRVVAKACPNLQQLTINSIVTQFDDSILNIAVDTQGDENTPRMLPSSMQRLTLTNCNTATDDLLTELLSSVTLFTGLHLYNVDRSTVTDKFLLFLAEKCRSLSSLRISPDGFDSREKERKTKSQQKPFSESSVMAVLQSCPKLVECILPLETGKVPKVYYNYPGLRVK